MVTKRVKIAMAPTDLFGMRYSHDLAHGKYLCRVRVIFDPRVGDLAPGKLKNQRVKLKYGQCRNYRTEVEEDEGTVIYRTLLFYNYVFLGRYGKKCI